MEKVDAALTAEPATLSGLPLLKLTLKERLEVIRKLDSEVIELIEEEEVLTTEIQQADEYRESMLSYLLRIEATLRPATPPTGRATASADASKTAPSMSTTVKLPRLKLKAFAGDLTEWTPFWNLDEHLRIIEGVACESECDIDREIQKGQQTPAFSQSASVRRQELNRDVGTVARTISPLVAMWCLKSMLTNTS